MGGGCTEPCIIALGGVDAFFLSFLHFTGQFFASVLIRLSVAVSAAETL